MPQYAPVLPLMGSLRQEKQTNLRAGAHACFAMDGGMYKVTTCSARAGGRIDLDVEERPRINSNPICVCTLKRLTAICGQPSPPTGRD
jgi:hypothetical protein